MATEEEKDREEEEWEMVRSKTLGQTRLREKISLNTHDLVHFVTSVLATQLMRIVRLSCCKLVYWSPCYSCRLVCQPVMLQAR